MCPKDEVYNSKIDLFCAIFQSTNLVKMNKKIFMAKAAAIMCSLAKTAPELSQNGPRILKT